MKDPDLRHQINDLVRTLNIRKRAFTSEAKAARRKRREEKRRARAVRVTKQQLKTKRWREKCRQREDAQDLATEIHLAYNDRMPRDGVIVLYGYRWARKKGADQ